MRENKKRLEKALLNHIENQVDGKLFEAKEDAVSQNAMALMELWRMDDATAQKGRIELDMFIDADMIVKGVITEPAAEAKTGGKLPPQDAIHTDNTDPNKVWIPLDGKGKTKGLPLFDERELPIAEDLVVKMQGMTLDEVDEFLKKFKGYLTQGLTL